MDARLRKNLDFPLLLTTLALCVIGLIAVYSATHEREIGVFRKQLVWTIAGFIGMVIAASVDLNRFSRLTGWLYGLNLASLIGLVKLGKRVNGAVRWYSVGFFQFQPSELSKIALIVCLAVFLHHEEDRIRRFGILAKSLIYVGLPAALILKQPDLGTSLVVMASWLGMTFIAGARLRHLAVLMVCGGLLFGVAWKTGIIKDFQKNRIHVWIDPEWDQREAGYHVAQARIAIGSGQVSGKGVNRGTQSQGRFIPENQTDFIFTVIGEEGGFLGSALVVVLFGILLFRGIVILAHADYAMSRLTAAGIVSMFAFHVIVNIGMTIGVLPVTGVPLPFISYGGTAMLFNMVAVGLLLGIGMRRHRLLF